MFPATYVTLEIVSGLHEFEGIQTQTVKPNCFIWCLEGQCKHDIPIFFCCTDGHDNTHMIYRVSQEECARLREGVPYGKVYRYNPKRQCPKLNSYGDNGQRKVWASCGSTHCTYQLTSLINVCTWVWCPMTLILAVSCICASFRVRCGRVVNGLQCAVNRVMSVPASDVSCMGLGTLRTTMTCLRVFL
jgi:hypothetical protein